MSKDERPILEKLDQLIQLVAIGLIENKKQRDQIRLLALAGIKPVRIAEILCTTSNTVNVALSNLRSEGELPKGGKSTHGKS